MTTAARWLEVARLAERLRRERRGRPFLELVDGDAGAGRPAGVGACAPGGRTPRPALLTLVREGSGGPRG